jgi:D-glycero-D-manno-heptose 1,7-bisphosphate phosphatase
MVNALFLDRDGVINVDTGYPFRKEDIVFLEGVFSIVRKANALGYVVVVVTNQSGIGRGYFTEVEFWELMNWMKAQFESQDARIDAIYHCPHHPDIRDTVSNDTCQCRKPAPEMILNAVRDLDINPGNSILVGDKVSDILAAKSAGIHRRILIGEASCPDCTDLFSSIHELEAAIDEIL